MTKERRLEAGFVYRVTTPDGKIIFLSIISPAARKVKELGWPNVLVQYVTGDSHGDLNQAIYQGLDVRINGLRASEFIEAMPKAKEYEEIILKLE